MDCRGCLFSTFVQGIIRFFLVVREIESPSIHLFQISLRFKPFLDSLTNICSQDLQNLPVQP